VTIGTCHDGTCGADIFFDVLRICLKLLSFTSFSSSYHKTAQL
jgi:hypothetical protein